MLTRNHRQEALTRAYIQAVAAQAGVSCSFRNHDYGIDIGLHEVRRRGSRYAESGLQLDIQAKSTGAAACTDDTVVYDLDVKNYNDLRKPRVTCPRLLILLILPDDEGQWTEQTQEQLILRHASYWLSLEGWRSQPNSRSVRLTIPRINLFTPAALQLLLQRVRRGQPL